jgi:hypothetical protein
MAAIKNCSTNMREFVCNLSACKRKLEVKKEIVEKYKLSFNFEQPKASHLSLIYGFLITIPSDKTVLGVKTINNKEEDADESG